MINVVINNNDSSLYSDQYVTNNKDKRSYKVDFSKLNQIFGNNLCSTNLNIVCSSWYNQSYIYYDHYVSFAINIVVNSIIIPKIII